VTTLLLATNNKGKVEEFRQLLKGMCKQIVSLAEAGVSNVVEESGASFEENALIKAVEYARQTGMIALADDSGLEVDALGGEPGIRSARYAGAGASDEDRVRFLLSRLAGVPPERRGARFRCVIALATPEGKTATCEGQCEGVIALEPKGTHGFGYDPVFYFPQFGKTMAELTPEEKAKVSHRGRAAVKVPRLFSLPAFSQLCTG
jgi:XTP/dITP diphosphohydrolase